MKMESVKTAFDASNAMWLSNISKNSFYTSNHHMRNQMRPNAKGLIATNVKKHMRGTTAWKNTRKKNTKRTKRTTEESSNAFQFQTLQELCDHIRDTRSQQQNEGKRPKIRAKWLEPWKETSFGVFKESVKIDQIKIPFRKKKIFVFLNRTLDSRIRAERITRIDCFVFAWNSFLSFSNSWKLQNSFFYLPKIFVPPHFHEFSDR